MSGTDHDQEQLNSNGEVHEMETEPALMGFVLCIVQIGSSGVIAFLQTSEISPVFRRSIIILMLAAYLLAICAVGLRSFGRNVRNFNDVVRILALAAAGFLTSALLLVVVFHFWASI